MHVDIRDLVTDDATAASELVSSLAHEHIAPFLGAGGIDALLSSLDVASTLQRLADGWIHLGAFSASELVGLVVVKPPLHLYHLFVRSDLQRCGIGTRLLAAADSRVIRASGSRLTTVNSSPNAVSAYEHFGFVTDGDMVDRNGVRFQPMSRPNDVEP